MVLDEEIARAEARGEIEPLLASPPPRRRLRDGGG
jgi:hypothetical protein